MKFTTFRKTTCLPLICLAALSIGSATARAQVLFNNGPADPGASSVGADGFFADTGNPSNYESGDVFTPTASGTALSISFAGFYFNGGTPTAQPADNFTISLYSVTPGTPDAPSTLISQSTLTGLTSTVFATSSPSNPPTIDPNSFNIYQFSGNLATPFVLSTSSEYFLGISDTTTPYAEFTLDVTNAADPLGPASDGWTLNADPSVPVGDPSESDPNVSFAFSLNATAVPEPSTWVLLACGMVGLAVLARIRRTAQKH